MTNSYAYQGTQDQASDSTLLSQIMFLVDQRLSEVRTSVPFKVMKAPYDKEGNTITPGSPVPIGYVDVQPMVNQLDGYGNTIPHGTVYRLSYHRYQGGNGAFISDPVIGDIGHGVVNDRDTSTVRSTNDIANPGSQRKFDLADGVYYGSQQSSGNPTQWFSWTANGFVIHDKKGNIISSDASGAMTITAPNGLVINGATITSAGEVIDALGKVLGTHTHTGVTPGGGNTGPPA